MEGGVFIEVESALVRDGGRGHEAANAGGNRNCDDLQVVDFEAVRVRDDHEGGDRGGDGRASDAHLGGDGGDTAGAFWADALFKGNIADDGHQGVHDVAGTHENREEERAERGENGDVVRVLTQEPLRNLDKPIHAPGGLHDARTSHRRDDDVDDVGRGLARLQPEPENQNRKADARDGAKREAPVA